MRQGRENPNLLTEAIEFPLPFFETADMADPDPSVRRTDEMLPQPDPSVAAPTDVFIKTTHFFMIRCSKWEVDFRR